jgi:serine/threonine-protein kinase
MPRDGDVFADRYTIECQVGKGGMGVVYKADQAPLCRPVAVKILKPPDSIEDDPKFDERFMREAAAAAKLHHANTITIHDFGQTDRGQLFIVMEYLEGRDLRSVLRTSGPFPAERTIHVAAQICRSLREAHGKEMVHRDLKPANVVLIERDGDPDFVKVLDFGLVKYAGEDSELTLAGKFVGSPKYTSPEALDRTKKIDHRADIYSLGILIYTMLAGQAPFSGDPIQVLTAHLREEPPPLQDINPMVRSNARLDRVIARCLKKDPADRFASMESVLEALLACKEGGPTSTLVLGGDSLSPPRNQRILRVMGLVIALAVAVIALGAALLWFGPQAPEGGSDRSLEVGETSLGEGSAPGAASAVEVPNEKDPAADSVEGITEKLPDSAQTPTEADVEEKRATSKTETAPKPIPPTRRRVEPAPEREAPVDQQVSDGYKSNPY